METLKYIEYKIREYPAEIIPKGILYKIIEKAQQYKREKIL